MASIHDFSTPRCVTGSASAPLCTHFSQCCRLCHKPCRVPFLTSLCCLPRSCTLPSTNITHAGSYWYITWLKRNTGSHEASKFCSTLDFVKSQVGLKLLIVLQIDVSQWLFSPALQLICASVSTRSLGPGSGNWMNILCPQNCFAHFFTWLPAFFFIFLFYVYLFFILLKHKYCHTRFQN